ncbi:MAG TPA: LysR family transcriptional regulator [Ramlibacter sp.]|nr:LysR family transcriptional regulator [Ramlibacter sp.]
MKTDQKKIDSRQLMYFAAIAEELHFGRAADRLGVAQSALSTQIQRLERGLGVRLLDRNKRQPISLTDAGALLYEEALAVLRHIHRAEEIGTLAARGLAGVVRVGYVASAVTTGLLATTLRRFRASHAQVGVNVIAMETPRQLEAIANGDVDVGIVRPRRQYPDGVKATIVHTERVLVAMPDDHRLARKASVKASELRGEQFVSPQFDESEGFSEILTRLGEAGGFVTGQAYRVNDFLTAVSLSAAGYGVVVVPESLKQLGQPGVVYKPIADFKEQVHLALAERERVTSPAVRAFAASARAVLKP